MAEQELTLRYGCNPHQVPARIYASERSLPFEVLSGAPGYINMLDALNSWQLVKELEAATGLQAAASFKHVSPAGAAVAVPMNDALRHACLVEDMDLSPLAIAYARARGADRMSSFGDWIALSDTVDLPTANLIRREVSDGVIAPGYEPEALEMLRQKRKGRYVVLQIDPDYAPALQETRQVFGLYLEQKRNDAQISAAMFKEIVTQAQSLTDEAIRDLLVAQVTLKYTQSNSICLAWHGQAIGVGAGQQSRIHCTRLAADKADIWFLRQHPSVLDLPFKDDLSRAEKNNAVDGYLRDDLSAAEQRYWEEAFTETPQRLTDQEKRDWLDRMTGVSLGSDAFFPFRDCIDRAAQSGVRYVAQPGGSVRDDIVIKACDEYGMVMAFSGVRLFHH